MFIAITAALVYGLAVVGASFLLAWDAEVAQHDIPQALALTILALIAVLPEYAVDMYLAFQAGRNPESNYGELALANMTGANRLLIGEATLLLILFLGQFFILGTHTLFTIIYLVLGVFFLFRHRQNLYAIGRRVMTATMGQQP